MSFIETNKITVKIPYKFRRDLTKINKTFIYPKSIPMGIEIYGRFKKYFWHIIGFLEFFNSRLSYEINFILVVVARHRLR
jgi:hypothetical protein